jgi:hypothetical protein
MTSNAKTTTVVSRFQPVSAPPNATSDDAKNQSAVDQTRRQPYRNGTWHFSLTALPRGAALCTSSGGMFLI